MFNVTGLPQIPESHEITYKYSRPGKASVFQEESWKVLKFENFGFFIFVGNGKIINCSLLIEEF